MRQSAFSKKAVGWFSTIEIEGIEASDSLEPHGRD